jgi:hypothetical protein
MRLRAGDGFGQPVLQGSQRLLVRADGLDLNVRIGGRREVCINAAAKPRKPSSVLRRT